MPDLSLCPTTITVERQSHSNGVSPPQVTGRSTAPPSPLGAAAGAWGRQQAAGEGAERDDDERGDGAAADQGGAGPEGRRGRAGGVLSPQCPTVPVCL